MNEYQVTVILVLPGICAETCDQALTGAMLNLEILNKPTRDKYTQGVEVKQTKSDVGLNLTVLPRTPQTDD